MFIPATFSSVNSVSDLPCGRYHSSCGIYSYDAGGTSILMFEYAMQPTKRVLACDFIFIDAVGTITAADFVLLKDRLWRDNYGARAASLIDLLPTQLRYHRLVRTDELGDFELGEKIGE